MVSYGITLNWKKSLVTALILTCVVNLLDKRGVFYDCRKIFNKYIQFPSNKDSPQQIMDRYLENFEIKPAGDLVEDKGNSYANSKTEETDNTNFNDEDLDKILNNDEKEGDNENEHLKKAGGGLDQLKDLLDMAKKESPYGKKDTKDYTPAQAQRATFHLIDTVKQLKETMNDMMPLMKAGTNLIQLHKQMGGDELTSALKN